MPGISPYVQVDRRGVSKKEAYVSRVTGKIFWLSRSTDNGQAIRSLLPSPGAPKERVPDHAGYRDQRILGFEVGYTDLGSVSAGDKFGDHVKVSGDGGTFGLNGHFNPTQHGYISSHVGGFLWKLHGKARLVYNDNTSDSARCSNATATR